MFKTALSFDAADVGGRTAQWRQLIDLLMQADGDISAALRGAVVQRIDALRGSVPVEQRRRAATQLAARATAVEAVALFGSDEPGVAAPVLMRAQLSGADWQAMIPLMSPASRALLRNRRDLPEAALRALASYGLSDFALPPRDASKADAGTQIRDLVARIEAFRLGSGGSASPHPAVPARTEEFAFETSAEGVIDWASGAPREPLIGISVADIADAGGYGVDGQAAGAFRRRAPFRDARLAVAGNGPAAGGWLISAMPVFNPRDGRFAGYHGAARRPRADEIAAPAVHFAGTNLPVDSLRQLIHELRTPLNGILGFAEMIDCQLLGPAAMAYREQAQAILQDGQRLLTMVDDLDQAALAGRDAAGVAPGQAVDAKALLAQIEFSFRPTLVARGIVLNVEAAPIVEVAGVSPAMLERMFNRLIGSMLGLARANEIVSVSLENAAAGQAVLSVARPAALASLSDAVLLDPGYDPETPYPDGQLLGLGFTLRLIANFARDVGGRLAISADALSLILPGLQLRADLPVGTP